MKQTEFAKIAANLVNRGEKFAVATVVKIEGSSLGKPGFKVIISRKGEVLYGSLGGSCPESAIVATAKKTLATGIPKTVKVFLENVDKAVEGVVKSQSEDEIHVETNCGGTMEIYVEPYLPPQRLVLIGQGGKDDVEDTLVKLGKILDFEVIVIDHSPLLTEEPDLLIKELDYDISSFKFLESDSVVVLTKGARDVEVIQALSKHRLGYVGLLASRQRVKEDFEELKNRGMDEHFISSVRAPVGADIGAVSPSEIALSIMAEVVATKYGKAIPTKNTGEIESAVQIGRQPS